MTDAMRPLDHDPRPAPTAVPCRIRPIVLLLITRPRDGAVLVQPCRDAPGEPEYWRFPGGGIEFGETIEQAAHREAGEELGAALAHVQLLRHDDYIFGTPQSPRHELAFIVSAIPADRAIFERESFGWIDGDGSEATARWIPQQQLLNAAAETPPRLRPPAVAGLIRAAASNPETCREIWAGFRDLTPRIRTVARCIIRRPRDGAILVVEAFDENKNERFCIPPGGGVQFGERIEEAIAREMVEEFGARLKSIRPLTTIDNHFTFRGHRGHEIVLIHAGELADPALYGREIIPLIDGGESLTASWRPLTFFRSRTNPTGPPLYPEGLLEAIATSHIALTAD